MSISSRIEETVENWRVKWGKALYDFLTNILSFGLTVFMDVIGKAFAPKLKPIIEELEKSEDIPDWILPILKEIKEPTGEVGALLAHSAESALVGGAIGKITDALFMRFAYDVNSRIHPLILGPEQLMSLYRRFLIKPDELPPLLKKHGLDDDAILQMIQLSDWIPFAATITEWVAKEVYEPDMVERYGLDNEFPTEQLPEYWKAGVNKEQALNFWRAHWEHASWTQVTEMLHRGLLTEEEVYDWFRLVEIPPFWRDKLIAMAYTWPTRVDVRRWYDMRTIDESRLRELYEGMGYHGDNLDDYVKWTKVYTDFGMMMTRFKNGWITEQDIRDWLKGLEIPEDRIQQFIEEKTKPEKAARTAAERDLTATDIIMGVKKGVIFWADGIELLMDLGYDEEEADFKLAVRIETEGGSPEGFPEYKRLTQLWRASQGLSTKLTLAEIKTSEKELAEKYPRKPPLTEEELKVKVDTIRRRRRNRQLTRDEEIAGLLELHLTIELATAYADNDDLRLKKGVSE